MNEETIKERAVGKAAEQSPEQLSDILLVLDKEKMRIQAVKSIDKDGKMETVSPTKKNQNEFMRVDKHGDFVSNFLSNFWRQLKDPTRFSFFKVDADEAVEKAKQFQKQIKDPTPEGKKEMAQYEVRNEPEQEQKQEEQKQTEPAQTAAETDNYRYLPEEIDWETMNNLGLNKERLEKLNVLDSLLKGYKTNVLVPVSINLDSAIIRTDARLSLQTNAEGKVVAAIHGIRREPGLDYEFFGHKFTNEDKKNLRETGNMGRVVELKNPKTGEVIPSVVSIDRLTNEIIALRTEYIKIPEKIKGVKLSDEQRHTLSEGKPLFIKGMLSTKGTAFDAKVQFNADKRYVEFLFDRSNNRQFHNNQQTNQQNQPQEAPRTFRGKELDGEQYSRFKDGESVYIELTDKKGQPYQGYVTFDKENGKTTFEFPSRYKERIKSADTEKRQAENNSNDIKKERSDKMVSAKSKTKKVS